jgi:XTP/dITP diphosphohydrolase
VDRVAALASRNAHKARELEVLLPGWAIEPLDRDDYPEETGATYYENALAKARFGHASTGGWAIGEDSGIEVEALGGRPGIHSARYAAEAARAAGEAGVPRPEDRVAVGDPGGLPAIAKLLGELEGVENRRARYVSELVAVSPDGAVFRGTGVVEGRVADSARGSGGFGYDPVFVPDGETRTVGELGDEWKARNSHRARAAGALRETVERGGLAQP